MEGTIGALRLDDLADAERKALGQCHHAILGVDRPLHLDCGVDLGPYRVAYQTYGTLNAEKSNAVLICHALTGDQFVNERHPVTGKEGWWDSMIGPGKVLDPAHYYIICANVLGGCMGTTGPLATDPASGKPWNLRFPVVTVADMVRAQAALLDHLGIADLFCVIGGSMGGMQVLEWAASFPKRVFAAVPIACAARHSAQNIAFHEVGRQAIMADPEWRGGDYRLHKTVPARGLAVARMTAHITYLSEQALQRKFGRSLQNRNALGFGFDADFQVESYLRYQGSTFVERFDANSYLYITRAMDYFDLADAHGGVLANAFRGSPTRFCLVSFTSDWLFPTHESRDVVHALNAVAANVSFVEIESDKGHDAFLLEEPEMFRTLAGFLKGAATVRGLRGSAVNATAIRVDLQLIADMVDPSTRALDVGCGDGSLLAYLVDFKQVDARGMELSQAGVNACVANGLSVIQGDADTDLGDYPDDAFDYVILSQTLQATREPRHVLQQMLRVGKRAIVSFPNFAHWQVRLRMVFGGRMPETPSLPYKWYDTPNIHLCSIDDFRALCDDMGVRIERAIVLDRNSKPINLPPLAANLLGEQAVFMLRRD